MEKQLKDLTDIEIKAICYDLLAQQQNIQQNLTTLNQELVRRAQQIQNAQANATQSASPVLTRSFDSPLSNDSTNETHSAVSNLGSATTV